MSLASWLPWPAIAVLLVLAAVTYRQIGFWGDNLTLWSHALEVTRDNYLAENIVGFDADGPGTSGAGAASFPERRERESHRPLGLWCIGAYDQQHGDRSRRSSNISRYRCYRKRGAAQSLAALHAFARMGSAYRQLKDFEQARQSFQKAVDTKSQQGPGLARFGNCYAVGGRFDGAVPAYHRPKDPTF